MQDVLNFKIVLPDIDENIGQDKEWITVDFGERTENIRLHDYDRLFSIPGLYEELIYGYLKCKSPEIITGMFIEMLEKANYDTQNLRVMDFGAGNGMMGEYLKDCECDLLVGVDIIPEAREATYRDRPGIYDDYLVVDMTFPGKEEMRRLNNGNFNALVTVAALGFGDIPPQAFINVFNLIQNGGWIGFNIKDRFLTQEDNTGYKELLNALINDSLIIYETKRYCHRYSITGEPLYYQGIVGKKVKDYKC